MLWKKKQTRNRNRNPKLNVNKDKNIDIQFDDFNMDASDNIENGLQELTLIIIVVGNKRPTTLCMCHVLHCVSERVCYLSAAFCVSQYQIV